MQLVQIEWLDSILAVPGWENLAKYEPFKVCKCVSVGFLVYDGKITTGIAQSLADLDDQKNTQIAGVMYIPTVSISKITVLNK